MTVIPGVNRFSENYFSKKIIPIIISRNWGIVFFVDFRAKTITFVSEYKITVHSIIEDEYSEAHMRRKDRQIENLTEVMQILQKADVCRIALSDDNVPYMVTMNFGLGKKGTSLYFHSAFEGKKIDILKKNNLVCFQTDIDHELILHAKSCGCSMKYQSVVGMGRISFVSDTTEKIEALQAIMTHYTQKSEHIFKEELVERTLIMRLDIEEVSGKALVMPGHQK
jgi:uncharacterized protein